MEGKSVSDDNIDSNKKENDATQTLNDQKNDGTEIVVESSTHSTDGSSNKTVAEEPATDVKGWLQKRTKGLLGMSYKWERQWFQLKGTELLYGENEQSLPKKIQLAGAEITESDIDNKTFAFGIKPKDSKRTHYIHAESEEQQQNWMQAICMAKLNKSGEGGACSIH